MIRPITIALFAVCLSQSNCGHATSQQGTNDSPRKGEIGSNYQLAQTDSKVLSGEQHWVKGNMLRDNAKYEDAVKEYRLAIANGYDSNWVRTELGLVLDYYLHRHDEAIDQFRIAIRRDDTDWRAHWFLATTLLEIERFDESLKELQTVRRLDPRNSSTGFYTYYSGKALDGLGRYAEALKDYQAFLERAKKIEPDSPRVREVRARVEVIKEKVAQQWRPPNPGATPSSIALANFGRGKR